MVDILATWLAALSGVAIASLIGLRSWRTWVSFSIVAGALLKLAAFTAASIFSMDAFTSIWITLTIICIGASLMRHRFGKPLVLALATVSGMTMVAFSLSRFTPGGLVTHSDSVDVLWLASTVLPEGLFPPTMRRGLLLPLLLLNPWEGGFLIEMVVLIGLVLFWSLAELGKQVSSLLADPNAYLIALALTLSTPLVLLSVFYVQSHTLISLALSVGFTALIDRRGEQLNFRTAPAIFLAGFAISVTRAEGFLIAVLLGVLVWHFGQKEGPNLAQRITLITGPVGLVLWWTTAPETDSPIQFMWAAGAIAILALIALTAPKPFINWVLRRVWALPIFALLLVPFLNVVSGRFSFYGYVRAAGAQFNNLFALEGGWGLLPIVWLVGIVFLLHFRESGAELDILKVVLAAIALTLVVKFLDGSSFGRLGFSDSINRGWLHLLPLWFSLSVYVVAKSRDLFMGVVHVRVPFLDSAHRD